MATGKGQEIFGEAERIATELEARGLEVLYDDRPKVSPGVKFKDSELLGMPTSVVVGRSLAQGVVELRDRASGEIREVSPQEIVDAVVTEVRGAWPSPREARTARCSARAHSSTGGGCSTSRLGSGSIRSTSGASRSASWRAAAIGNGRRSNGAAPTSATWSISNPRASSVGSWAAVCASRVPPGIA